MINDVYEEEDVLTAVEHNNNGVRSGGKTVRNCSDYLVILMDKKKRPIFIENKNEHFLRMKTLEFFPTVVVFR